MKQLRGFYAQTFFTFRTIVVFNTYCFSTSMMVTRTGLSVALYVHCVSCSCLYWDLQNLWMWSIVTEMPRPGQVLTAAGRSVRCVLLC